MHKNDSKSLKSFPTHYTNFAPVLPVQIRSKMVFRRDELALLCALHLVLKKKKKRSLWNKKWLLARLKCNHTDLLEELRLYPADFRNFLRMDEDIYLELLNVLSPFIEKEDTILRKSISTHELLTATLRFLATGCSYEDLNFSTMISPQALGQTHRHTLRQTNRHTEISHTDILTNTQIDTQINRQTDTRTNRQRPKHTAGQRVIKG